MSLAHPLAAAAGASAAIAIMALLPDLASIRAVLVRRRRRVGSRRSNLGVDRGAPLLGIVVATVLMALDAPVLALVAGGGPLALRALDGARRARRRRRLAATAPQVARAVADGLDAGLALPAAITSAAGSAAVDGPAADAARRTAARLAAGEPLPVALDRWRRRTDEPAHSTLIGALLLHADAGGELAAVLRGQAAALDRARRQAAEAESALVQARAAARIVGGIPAAAMALAVVLAPEAVRGMVATVPGAVLVATAIGLQALAVVAVRRLTTGRGR